MINANIKSKGGNKYEVEVGGVVVHYNIDGYSFVSQGATNSEAWTREDFIALDNNPIHAEALMDYLNIESVPCPVCGEPFVNGTCKECDELVASL